MAEDPFPRERVMVTLRRLPAYVRLAWHLAREPLLSKARRAAVIGAAGYLVSPVDLVPGIVPVLGQLDDIAVAIAALRFALAGLSPEQRRRHLEAVGLEDSLLAEDLRSIAAATAWTIRAGARTTGRAARRTGTAAVAGARAPPTRTRSAANAAGTARRARPQLQRDPEPDRPPAQRGLPHSAPPRPPPGGWQPPLLRQRVRPPRVSPTGLRQPPAAWQQRPPQG